MRGCPGLRRSRDPDDSPESLDAIAAGRRGRRQLVVIAAADELEPALAAGPLAALLLSYRPAADAARDRQATRRLHGLNISSALAVGSWPMPGLTISPVRPPDGARRPEEAGANLQPALPRLASPTGFPQLRTSRVPTSASRRAAQSTHDASAGSPADAAQPRRTSRSVRTGWIRRSSAAEGRTG